LQLVRAAAPAAKVLQQEVPESGLGGRESGAAAFPVAQGQGASPGALE